MGIDKSRIYLTPDGKISLSADWDIGDGKAILADKIRARDGDGLALYDDGDNGIFIEDGGNVGLGTIDPEVKFHIKINQNTNDPILKLENISIGNAATTELVLFNDTGQIGTWFGVGSNYNIIAGVAGNSMGFFNVSATGDLIEGTGGAGDYQVWTAFTERLRVLNNGNIGMNVSAPLAKLHIDQSVDDAAIPVLILDQADTSEGFINFIGSDRGVIGEDANSVKSVCVELGGVVYRLALYADA